MGAPYVQTFTPVIGSLVCNANCPYCCSRMTCKYGLGSKPIPIDWNTFDIAAQIARERQCVNAFITSKGEPTLFHGMVGEAIIRLKAIHKFPLIELQTNGMRLDWLCEHNYLNVWRANGLNLVCISAVHYEREFNQKIYGPKYPDLKDAVLCCLNAGLQVRISCVMLKDFIDTVNQVEILRNECTKWGAKQLVIRPVNAPAKCRNPKEAWRLQWIKDNIPDKYEQKKIFEWLEQKSLAKRNLAHGAKVYSIQLEEDKPEVNICLSNCFTPPSNDEEIRQIIWLPDGTITDNWDHEGLVIL